MSKTVVFDIDGVLADFIRGFLVLANSLGYDVPVITAHEHQKWGTYPGLSTAQVAKVWGTIHETPTFWGQLTPLASVAELLAIRELIENGNNVYFATNRNQPWALQVTYSWLHFHLRSAQTSVVVTSRKGEFCRVAHADYYIDDKSENIDCAIWMTDKRTKAYVITRPYNLGIYAPHSRSARRVASLTEFLGDVNGDTTHASR